MECLKCDKCYDPIENGTRCQVCENIADALAYEYGPEWDELCASGAEKRRRVDWYIASSCASFLSLHVHCFRQDLVPGRVDECGSGTQRVSGALVAIVEHSVVLRALRYGSTTWRRPKYLPFVVTSLLTS